MNRLAGLASVVACCTGCALPWPGGGDGTYRELVLLADVATRDDGTFASRDAWLGDLRVGGEVAGFHVGRSRLTVALPRSASSPPATEREVRRRFAWIEVVDQPKRVAGTEGLFVARSQFGAGADWGAAARGLHVGLTHQTAQWILAVPDAAAGAVYTVDYDSDDPAGTEFVRETKEGVR